MTVRCPFCDFDRSHPPVNDPDWSAVQSMRELAVHLVYRHPGEWDELVQTAGARAEAPRNPCLICGEEVDGPLGPHMVTEHL